MPKKCKSEPLTPREEQIAARVASGETVSSALRAVGANPHSASYRRRLKPGGDMHEEVRRIADKHGVTLDRLFSRLRRKLDARETKFFAHEGIVQDHRNVVAHGVQMQAIELGLKAHGALIVQREDVTPDAQPPDVHVHFEFRLGGQAERDVTPGNGGNGHNGHGGHAALGTVLRSLGLTVRADRGDGPCGSEPGGQAGDAGGGDSGAGA